MFSYQAWSVLLWVAQFREYFAPQRNCREANVDTTRSGSPWDWALVKLPNIFLKSPFASDQFLQYAAFSHFFHVAIKESATLDQEDLCHHFFFKKHLNIKADGCHQGRRVARSRWDGGLPMMRREGGDVPLSLLAQFKQPCLSCMQIADADLFFHPNDYSTAMFGTTIKQTLPLRHLLIFQTFSFKV